MCLSDLLFSGARLTEGPSYYTLKPILKLVLPASDWHIRDTKVSSSPGERGLFFWTPWLEDPHFHWPC